MLRCDLNVFLILSSPAVNKMIKEHSDLFSDSQCKVCSAVLISESQKLTHYQVSEPTCCCCCSSWSFHVLCLLCVSFRKLWVRRLKPIFKKTLHIFVCWTLFNILIFFSISWEEDGKSLLLLLFLLIGII